MSNLKTKAEIAALRDAALEDLMSATDAELRQEAIDDGEDMDAIAMEVKAAMREAASEALRQRMRDAKTRFKSTDSARLSWRARPPLEEIKRIVQSLFASDQSIGLAFRDGKRQTESDWQSLYDDLVAMGAIKRDENEC